MFVTNAEVGRLLASKRLKPWQMDQAVDSGSITKEKLEGIWLYHGPGESIKDALSLVARLLERTLAEYFIISMPMAPNMVAKRLSNGDISPSALKPMVRHMLRNRQFSAIGLLTSADLQPYLAIHLDSDRDAISKMLEAIARSVAVRGVADVSAVPNASRELRAQAWKQTLLAHGEFLGLGAIRNGSLVSWSRL